MTTEQSKEAAAAQAELEAFIQRAGFTYGWSNLESWARRIAERAVLELNAAAQQPAQDGLTEYQIACAADKHGYLAFTDGQRKARLAFGREIEALARAHTAPADTVAWMVLDCVNLKPSSVTLDQTELEDHNPEHVVELVRKAPRVVPAEVMAALDRMCTPLHESRLSGVTANEDARCMKVIRDYILRSENENG